MKVPLLDLKYQYATMRDEIRSVLDEICDEQAFILGPHVKALEDDIAAYCGTGHAIGASSGTDALILALMALEIGHGHEVVTTPFTFFGTAGSIARVGAKPVFVDIDPVTFNIDPNGIDAALTSNTKAVMPVDLFGQLAEMDAIQEIARHRKLRVIQDSAQSLGAKHHGKTSGRFADLTTFSFYPTKNMGAFGDAGMVVTDDAALAERCRILRVHGAKPKYFHHFIGGNFRLDALQAAVLRVKLRHLDKWSDGRRRNAAQYDTLLAGLSDVITPSVSDYNESCFNQYTIRITGGRRDAVRKNLQEMGIGTEVYYPLPLHLQKCFAYLGHQEGDFPESERAAKEVLSIPIYPELTDAQIDAVCAAIKKSLE
ncbi:MAG: DegT/DnrJ/EryC1/StrS family aminotransferase [Planctomycetota bacterium]|nr:DegT/DnrJ/EryC1/StrS family aminotransferase [Planctomycetota bacterium]